MASELTKLIDSNTIRVLDLVMIMKGDDGSVEASELRDADDSEIGELRALERDLAILLAEEDVEEIGASLEPGSAAAVLVGEHAGRRHLASLCAAQEASFWATAGSRPRRSSPRSRPTAKPERKEHEDGTIR